MATTSHQTVPPWTIDLALWRCVGCGGSLAPGDAGLHCSACTRSYPIRDGILIVKDNFSANNRVVREYYDGPEWPKFRFWEWLTFVSNGGERRSRNKILRHL